MSKKIILILLVFLFSFSFYHFVYAGVIINEVMYNLESTDMGREWVEVYNNSNSSVDLSSYKFFESDTNHELTIFQGDANIGVNGYAVIVSDPIKFKIDWPSFSGIIFDSSFSLNNTGEAIAIKDGDLNIIDQYTYNSASGGAGDGNSLQLINGLWQATLPTPGKENKTVNLPSPPSNDSNNSTQTIIESKPKITEISQIKTNITAKTIAFVGIPLSFSANTTGYSNEPLFYGKYFWNFGDGDSKETKANDKTNFTHTFFYEGEYTVALEYFQNYYSQNSTVSDKMIIKVVPADILISKVGDEKDFFIEITNNTSYNADLSKWTLLSKEKSFTLPRNTILQPKKKIILSPKITGFSILDKNTLRLVNLQWETIFDYASSIKPVTKPIKTFIKKSILPKVSTTQFKTKNLSEDNTNINTNINTKIPINNLTAQAINSGLPIADNPYSKYGVLGFIVLLIVSASGAYFIRGYNRKVVSKIDGSDFEIIDE